MEKIVTSGDKLQIAFQLNSLVIQPTSLCNLNCTYCYLPHRNTKLNMPVSLAYKIADELSNIDLKHTVNIIWHSGEPLVCGIEKLSELIEPFEKLRHEKKVRYSIQTNGTLINQDWCELFLNYNIAVGVSIDGPRELTKHRVDWKNQDAYDKIIKGIECLNKHKVSFGVICVVTQDSVSRAKELYRFFCDLGCESAGFSIVEEEGVNTELLLNANTDTTQFWRDLLEAWMENPIIGIREFRRATVWLESVINNKQSKSVIKDILPSIGYNGDVVLLSPEFLNINPSNRYKTFVSGNIWRTSLSNIINDGLQSEYILEYLDGMKKCQNKCEYFSYCRGGDASNKYFELGRLDVDETNHCRNTRIHLVDAILENL